MSGACRESGFVLDGVPVTGQEVRALCERVRLLLARGGQGLVCDVSRLTEPDLSAVDLLARMELIARRLGRSIRFCHAPPRLRALLEAAGLEEVVRLELGVETCGQTELGEEPGRVEEGIHGDDLPA